MWPRWPYDTRPSVRAEKYIRDASGWRKDVTDGNDNGTDGETDRQSATQYAAPPREEGRIIIPIIMYVCNVIMSSMTISFLAFIKSFDERGIIRNVLAILLYLVEGSPQSVHCRL